MAQASSGRAGERGAEPGEEAGRDGRRLSAFDRLRLVLLACLFSLLTVNVWTGGPLLALWLGSRVQGFGPPSMTAIAVVAGSLVAISLVLVRALTLVGHRFDRLAGRDRGPREPAPWHRSLRGERPAERDRRFGLSVPERIVVVSVVAAIVAFEIWFFFFSGSPIGGGSGR